jgi:hypothetical protein
LSGNMKNVLSSPSSNNLFRKLLGYKSVNTMPSISWFRNFSIATSSSSKNLSILKLLSISKFFNRSLPNILESELTGPIFTFLLFNWSNEDICKFLFVMKKI